MPFKIDQEDFNRKAQHILDTVVRPQVERYEKAKAEGELTPKPRQTGASSFDIEQAAANLADPNACKTENWIAGAKWMQQQMEKAYKKGRKPKKPLKDSDPITKYLKSE